MRELKEMGKARPYTALHSGRKTRPPFRRTRTPSSETDPTLLELDLENRFKMLETRLNEIDSQEPKPSNTDYFASPVAASLEQNEGQSPIPIGGFELYSSQKNVNVSVSSSSESTLCAQSVTNMHIRIGSTSKQGKTLENEFYKEMDLLDVRNSSERILNNAGRNNFAIGGSTEAANIVIGRRNISSVNYRRGDTITFTLQDQRSSAGGNGICSHCTCCKHVRTFAYDNKLNELKDSSSRESIHLKQPPGTTRDRARVGQAGKSGWDTFTQLKKVSSQWQEIAKRYVPKTDKEFWKMIRGEVVKSRDKNVPRLQRVVDNKWRPNILTEPFNNGEEVVHGLNMPRPSGITQYSDIYDEQILTKKTCSKSLSDSRQLLDPGDQIGGSCLRVKEWNISDLFPLNS